MDGKCIYCRDRSAGAPALTVSWTLLPSFYWFSMCCFSFSCCQYLVLDVIHYLMWIVIGYVVVEGHRDFSL
jgi:hypothetical protein